MLQTGTGPPAATPSADWRGAYDLDGDGEPDRIVDDFSGGAHCCYRIGATLSSTGQTVMLPFEMDGGYVGGLDLSQPEQFSIRTPNRALPELVMAIGAYGGQPQPLDRSWTRRFGIRTRRVAIYFPNGQLRVRDFHPELSPCRPDS